MAAWLVLVGLVVLTVLRWTHEDSWWLVVVAIAVSPWLYLLAWIIAAVSAVTRRWAQAGLACVLTVISVVWLVPQWYPVARAATATAGAVTLRLFDANVEYSNPSLAGIAGEIRVDRPDLITLEEFSYSNMESLLTTGVLARYHWRFTAPSGGANGFGVWSDLPMTGAEVWFAGQHPEVRAWLHPRGTPRVRLYVIHTDAPLRDKAGAWHHEMSDITSAVRAESRPLLVLGDFNATWDMYEFQDVLHTGLKDAAVEEGKGWEMTWSRQSIIPPLVRIDHVLYSPGLTVTSYRTGVGRGSDHHPVLVRLAITRS